MTPDQAFDFYAQPETRSRRDQPADGLLTEAIREVGVTDQVVAASLGTRPA